MATQIIPKLFSPNVKQLYLPFVLDPNAQINNQEIPSETGNGIAPQLFTFRGKEYVDAKSFKGPKAQLGVVPYSFRRHFNKDLSYRMLYRQNASTDEIEKTRIKFNDLLDTLPGVQIREFLPDSRLDQAINLINTLLNAIGIGVTDLLKEGGLEQAAASAAKTLETATKDAAQAIENACRNAKDFIPWILEYICSETKTHAQYPAGKSLATDLVKNDLYKFSFYSDQQNNGVKYELMKTLILSLPYQLYFKLQACATTNIYEIPFNNDSKGLYSSTGTPGWDGASGFVGSLIDSAKGLLGSILPNVNVQWAPWYNAMGGEKTPEDGVVLSFDLFNDDADAAMNNFIFVNTIIPQNRWLQYGLFQHSPCLYDIKIEGVKRLFLCTGEFKVTQGGVLRTPTKKWISDLISVHGNNSLYANDGETLQKKQDKAKAYTGSEEFYTDIESTPENADEIVAAKQAALDKLVADAVERIEYAIKNNTIRIPDVYHVELTFKSLLPANFNTYIMQFAENDNHIEKYSKNSYEESNVIEKLKQVAGKVKEYMSLQRLVDTTDASYKPPATPGSSTGTT